ncbi:related to multidrug resistance-associated protein [Fusarium torulosum]|uniref:Related to multidrug resistance-associated protein n=1 Tax=Fusarium torulosum TaxID=33205 RepID=A0AAE8SIU8_9HYPO|nr:related to multidrug resistance-associated protein [Fusarium torulosum]
MSLLESYSQICRDNTFGPTVPGLAECRGGFDFTVTFEESILSLAPACLIIAITPWRIYSLWLRPSKTRGCWLLNIKLFGFVALAALHAVLLAFLSKSQTSHRALLISSGTFQLLASILITALSYWEHQNAIRPSFILSAFLFLTTLLDAARARTQSFIPDSDTVAGILIAIVVAKLLLFLVETKDKASILLPEYSKSSPELRSSLFSRAFFTWLFPVLSMGFKSVISSDDLPAINEKLASQTLTAKVERRWKKRGSVGALSLFIDILSSFPKELCIILLANLVQVGLNICQPFLIQELVTFLSSSDRSINVGYGLLGGFFCVSITNALVIPWGFHYVGRLMTMTRGALVPLIYSKLLQLKGDNLHQMTAFTLMTADVETIVNDSWRLLEPWAHLLQIAIGTYLLYRQLGAVCCIPIIVILLIFTLVAVIGSRIGGHQSAWFDKIEKRIDLTSHTLSFLHPVKLLGLSRIMEEKLHKRREDELQTSQKFRVTNCSALAFASAPQALAPLVTFGAYSIARMVAGQPNFSEATAVASFSILNLISAPAMQLLLAIPMGAQAIGCYGRIQSFLQTPEDLVPSIATTNSSDVTSQSDSQEKVIEPESSTALERIKQPCEKIEVLSDPRGRPPVRFVPSRIIAITGPSGCGKSTLLRRLLTFEQSQASGIFPSGDIAYCSQTPWIFEGTVRDNILGQSEVDSSWYQSVLRSCELRVDLDSMPNSDATQVGSGGSKLSGGQKQRIAIARALYSKKKRVILDDITSALDGHTASSLITNLFSENGTFRSQDMSVIVATHSVQILRLADQVLLMDQDGQVIDSGPYAELVTRQEHYSQHQTANSSQTSSSSSEDAPVQVVELEATRGEYEARLQTKVDDLRRKKGDWRSFTYYLGTMGWLGFSIFVACIGAYMVLNAIFGVWLVWWAEDAHDNHGLGYWLGLYATWAVLITIGFLVTPIFFFTKLASKASHVMHADLLTATMRAPLSALSNTEDTASLVNRFSQDIRLCDWQLPFNILLTLMALVACLASIGVAISAVPYLAIGAPAIAIVLYLLQMLYLRTSRQLRLLELEQKAPIVSLFLDSIQGMATIHSFGWSPAYVQKSYSLLDSCQKPLYTLYCIQRWLILVLSLIATGTELVVIGAAIALRTKVSAGLVGLAVVHVTTLAKNLCDLVMQWTDMETSLGAVSRIYRFSRETPREAQSGQGPSNLLEGWPLAGSITFENVSATYEDVLEDLDATTRLDSTPKLALDSITFTIKPGERVGICGRTGSGKSSLMAALLQILPCYQGRIFIDGTDLSTLHPEDVRPKLNYVTQEPFLFDGTMRENLRPWDSCVADQEMTAALEKVNLLKKVTSLGGLDASLTRDSFSHGERQLFCLARSLLRSSSIVILDEPTGHIDPVTDATIQHVIRDGFSGRTVIMIAHRLRTLLEFDTAVVLDHGRVKEIGPPKSLLNDSTSAFHALYHAAEGAATNTG